VLGYQHADHVSPLPGLGSGRDDADQLRHGDHQDWGKSYGGEALHLLLDHAFGELNLHRVQLTVLACNEPAIALYEKLGFVREGVYREFLLRDRIRFDMYLYGLLRREWEASAGV
jgi:RimJ/RimL family protein N-acetyltransferase